MSDEKETPTQRQDRERADQAWADRLAKIEDVLTRAHAEVFDAGHYTDDVCMHDERREQAVLNAIETALGLLALRRMTVGRDTP